MNFNEFGFEPSIVESLDWMGFSNATPIQEKAIPIILNGHDLIGCAQTGTGKTAAFVLPMIDILLKKPESSGIKALIVVPTRELATQIENNISGFIYFSNLSCIAVYGGGDGINYEKERKALVTGADIVIATPGRLISHINMNYVKFDKLQFLILDEADRMLDMGFSDDLLKIVRELPKKRQTLMFSATMPDKIRKLALNILSNPERVDISISKPASGIVQSVYLCNDNQKLPLVYDILSKQNFTSVLIFGSTKLAVKNIGKELVRKGLNAKIISSDLEQSERESVLASFRSKRTTILVATDVLSRGIDIDSIELVINFDVPPDPEDYVHRVGRTARAQTKGEAVTIVNEKDFYKLVGIERMIESEIPKKQLPEYLGPTPQFTLDGSNKMKNRRKKFKSNSKP
jgi:superfamily II DNA/RNA helicase